MTKEINGCIQIKKDSYRITMKETVQGTVFVNGVPTSVTQKIHRTKEINRVGKDWMDYLSNFTDQSDKIRESRIAIERLKNVDWCHPFTG
jgi:hypothetical protein